MKLTEWLPGEGTTEKPLVTDDPHHGIRSQPGDPARVHLSGRSPAEQLLQRSSPWVGIVLLLNLFCVDVVIGCRTPLLRAVVTGRSAHCCCSFCAGSQGDLGSLLSSSGRPGAPSSAVVPLGQSITGLPLWLLPQLG